MSDLQKLADKLETEGVDVDELRRIGPDPSLMYWYDEDRHTRDIAVVALTAAAVPSLITNVLAATAITTEGGEDTRVGLFSVERDAIREYRADKLTKKEYVQRVADTWENPWGEPMTDGGEDIPDALDPDAFAAIPDEELERYRKRRELFTCPECGEVADARLESLGNIGQMILKPWVELHTSVKGDSEMVYFHVDADAVDRGADLRTLAAKHAPEDEPEPNPREDPSHGDDRPDLDAYHRQRARERRPRTDGGEDVDWTEQYATTTYRGPQKYPVPGAWVLGMVEMDGIGWKHYPDVGEGASHDSDVMDADEYREGPDARASLISDHPDGADVMTDPPYHELKINGELVMVLKDASEVPEADWWRAIAEALARYDSGGEYETVLSDLGLEHLKADPYGATEDADDGEDADHSLDEFVPASSLETDGEPGGGS